MAAAVTAVPTGGVHAKDVFRFDITGVTTHDASVDTSKYPVQAEKRYYLAYRENSAEWGRSQVFGVTPDGAFQIFDYIFPHAGSWTVSLRDTADDSEVATAAVTVS